MPIGIRDSIEIQPFEIPWRNTTTTFPAPSYSDDNVKVYAIPVFPFAHLLPVTTPPAASTSLKEPTLDLSGKRKREPSSEYPSKRVNVGNEATTRKPEGTREPLSESLSSKLKELNNKPEALEGEYAEEYRKALIQIMFPATNIDTTGEATDVLKGGRKGKKSAGSAGVFIFPTLSIE
jgi:ribonuclease Z